MTPPAWWLGLFALVTIVAPIACHAIYRRGWQRGRHEGYVDGVRAERSAWARTARRKGEHDEGATHEDHSQVPS